MIDSIVIKESYFGDGSTTQFPFSFPFIDASDIKVTIHDIDTGEETTLTSDYYVDTINSKVLYPGYPPGEAPALSEQPGPLPVGQKLIVYRSTPISQLEDLGDKYPLPIIEDMVDKVTLILQELSEKLSRAVIVEIGSDTTPDQLLQAIADSVEKAKAWAEGTDAEVTEIGGTHSSEGWSNVSKKWAEGSDADVSPLGGTHSAKGWAEESETQAGNAAGSATSAANKATEASQWAEGTDEQVVALGGTHSAKVWAQTAAKVYYVDTMAAMRADSSLTPGMLVETKGYYTPNDGGNGTYNIRAAEAGDVDDGGSIIILDNGNVAELMTDGVVNIKQFGAAGDGVTDDTTKIQAAFDALAGGGIVLIPEGTFIVSNTIYVKAGCSIKGAGYSHSIIQCSTTNITIICANNTVTGVSPNYTTIEGFRITGAGKTSGQIGLDYKAYIGQVKDVSIRSTEKGMELRGVVCNIDTCYFNYNGTGIEIHSLEEAANRFSTMLNITSCTLTQNNTGIEALTAVEEPVVRLGIISCVFENGGKALNLSRFHNLTVGWCWFEKNTTASTVPASGLLIDNRFESNDAGWAMNTSPQYAGYTDLNTDGIVGAETFKIIERTSNTTEVRHTLSNANNFLQYDGSYMPQTSFMIKDHYIYIKDGAIKRTSFANGEISLTKNSTGYYTVTFTTRKRLSYYFATFVNRYSNSGGVVHGYLFLHHSDPATYRDYDSVTHFDIYCYDASNQPIDCVVQIMIKEDMLYAS